MFFRNLLLMLAASGCVASTAQAASIINIDMTLRYEGTVYSEGYLIPLEDDVTVFDTYLANGNLLGIPTLDPELAIGDQTFFRATLVLPDPETQPQMLDNGGRALSCQLGNMTCGTVTEVYQDSERLSVYWGEWTGLTTGLKVGAQLSYQFTSEFSGSMLLFDWGRLIFNDRFANFTIVDMKQPAPVPVPVSAALLPVGIGALAMLRRRRNWLSS